MYRLIKSKTEKVSPRRAEEFIKHNVFPGQRRLNQQWAQNIATKMTNGTFTKGHLAFAHNCVGDDVLMNGQHQLQSSIQSGETFVATIDNYMVENDDDMWHLFATFDTHRPRTEGHVMKAARGLFKSEPLQTVPLRILSACGSALVWLGAGIAPAFSEKVLSKSDKADLVQEYEEDVLWIASFDVQSINTAVVCAMIATHRKNRFKAQEFWDRVIHGDQLVRHSPQWRLHKGIADFSPSQCGGNRNILLYRLSILWWNAFVTGEKRTQAKFRKMRGLPEIKG